MAAHTIEEAIKKADIKLVIQESMLFNSPLFKVEEKVDAMEAVIHQNLRNQLRDLLSHRFQIFGFQYGCDSAMKRFFDELFGEKK